MADQPNPYAVAGVTTPETKQAWGFSGNADNVTMTDKKGADVGVNSGPTNLDDTVPSEARKNGGSAKTTKAE